MAKYDFSGVATKYGVKCGDGRTILPGSFDHQDGQKVPILWRHQHDAMDNVLGHGILRKTDSGMAIEAWFNDTDSGRRAKTLVRNSDLQYLSIWANEIVEQNQMVSHGVIREVSLVVAGRNPGAVITNVIAHSDDPFEQDETLEDVVIIHTGDAIETAQEVVEEDVTHSEEDYNPTIGEIMAGMTDVQQSAVGVILQHTLNVEFETSEDGEEEGETQTLEEVWETLSEVEQEAVFAAVDSVLNEETSEDEEEDEEPVIEQSVEGQNPMAKNIFESDSTTSGTVLSHSDQVTIMSDIIGGKVNSLQAALTEAVVAHGITDIDKLFPDAQNVRSGGPHIYTEQMAWVETVLGATKKTPFARIKSTYADITADDARARGYVKGAEKFEEVFPILDRTTTPQTIYKKQSIDRDDMIDITDFNVVAWLKSEMRMKLREELARAILIGDGRTVGHADKIKTDNIRPIYGDAAIYAHPKVFAQSATTLDIIDGVTASRTDYKGAGNPVLYCSSEMLTSMLLVRDADGRRIHQTEASLAAALRVSAIVEIPPMSNIVRTDGADTYDLLGIVVNLRDYVIGADKGGETTFFDDFDIDFNKYKYLYETRVSGALVTPKSAIVLEQANQ